MREAVIMYIRIQLEVHSSHPDISATICAITKRLKKKKLKNEKKIKIKKKEKEEGKHDCPHARRDATSPQYRSFGPRIKVKANRGNRFEKGKTALWSQKWVSQDGFVFEKRS